MRTCLHCGSEFEVGTHQTKVYCKKRCNKNAAKKRHHQKYGWGGSKRGASRKARDEARHKAKVIRNTDYVYADRIARGCSRCPERRPSALDYHHLDKATKLTEVSRLMRMGLSFDKLKAEMAKCIILCANCHRVEEHGDGYLCF